MTLELKDFVRDAITEIATAIKEADDGLEPIGGLVNPGTHKSTGGAGKLIRSAFVAPRTTLNFDIAVSAGSSKSGEGKAAAKIWVIEASVGGSGELKSETVSRLTFSIEVVFPHDINQDERIGSVRSPK